MSSEITLLALFIDDLQSIKSVINVHAHRNWALIALHHKSYVIRYRKHFSGWPHFIAAECVVTKTPSEIVGILW